MRKTSNEIMARDINDALVSICKMETLVKAKVSKLKRLLADVKKRHSEMPITRDEKAEHHKKMISECARRWREKNREKFLAYQREYYQKNREKVRAKQKERYQELRRLAAIAAKAEKSKKV